MTSTPTPAETQIRAVLEAHAEAHAARDAEGVVAAFAEDAVHFTLAPPLQQPAASRAEQVERTGQWLATFDGPVRIEHRDLAVTAEGDLAFAHALTRMSATPAGTTEPFAFWFRTTYGLRRTGDGWRVVHEHASTPFLMDGSFLAATGLEP